MAHCYLGINQGTQLRQLFALYLQGVNYIKMVFHYKTMQPCMYGSYVASGCRCCCRQLATAWPRAHTRLSSATTY